MSYFDIIFYLFAIITVASAFIVVTTRNIVYSAYSLLLTLFGISGIYVLLGADFLAVVQIMVYVGGILILLLFGVMLTNKITSVDIRTGAVHLLPAAISSGVLLGILWAVMTWTDWKTYDAQIPSTTIFGLGKILITNYVLIFELLAILLLVALIGAASIARREESEENN
ncbi:NADH dehydrogenase subunit J [Melioribacter roseus P3M-2]|uniref:NADH-quinone oxidoreductase subunit J n=1 Tax=Melioribacter roseus (strain DSM 23840 / JCM 17771 / VKM B-2668 / P3M-2) TaxID=1191523 RepID=I7A314_MELRP|nr:NADH-quinone oxidoreductase subunit J [Melioribacter roseus]AFN75603.1 NADH dehydrogenase subunit J [Melioribacter roseus P3M-2]